MPKDVMNVAFLSLGGNLGDRLEEIRKTLKAISRDCGTILKASSIYETDAWGSGSEKKYLNQVIKIETSLDAEALLKKTLVIEKKAGRIRTGHQYNDRIMDIDLLFFNDAVVNKKNIQLPHPRLHLRKFVLIPLCEIEKSLVHPVLKKSVATLLKECTDQLNVTVYNVPATLRYICIEGNIGSGKSTLAQAMVKKWQALSLPEKFEDNPLLPLFYKDPGLYAFPLEYSFLISRFQQISEALKLPPGKIIVSDFSFYKCLWFAKINLPAKEYLLFKKHFNALLEQMPKPDLVIYLDTPVKNLGQNIKKRGRPYEQKIKRAYLEAIDKKYKRGMHRLSPAKTLVIPVKSYYPQLEKNTIKIIENYIKENFARQTKNHTFSLHK